ncbi:MAG TPA: SRPBCC family protein [Leptolyngbyaceae cyanobacterium]
MLNYFHKNYRPFIAFTSAIALSLFVPLAVQALPQSGNFLTRLTPQEQTTLKAGDILLTGKNGHYTGHVLITAPIDTTWNVLIDYDNFKNFLPGVVSSRILENHGNQTIFEQVNQIKILLFTHTSRLVFTVFKQYPKQIDFELKEGEIKSLKGFWKLEPIALNQVLIAQDVTFDPGTSVTRDLAFTIYRNALAESLKAIKQETERRVAQR